MKAAQKFVLGLFLGCLLLAVLSGVAVYYRLAYFWGGVWLFAFLYSRLALKGVEVKRVTRTHRSQVGQMIEERIEVVNRSRLPRLWLAIEDESSLPGGKGSRVIGFLGSREVRSYFVRTRLVKRGIFTLGPTRIVAGDPFGLFSVERVFPPSGSLLVYPMTVEIKEFPNPAGWVSGGEALRRKTHQVTPNATGVREYLPGDSFNRIHWLSTARRNRLMVKEFELDPLSEVWVFIDACGSHRFGDADYPIEPRPRGLWRPIATVPLPRNTFEYQVVVAASLARHFLRIGRTVGLVAKDSRLHVLPAERGFRQLAKALEMLAVLEAEGDLPLPFLVQNQIKRLLRGSTIILISSALDKSLLQSAALLSAAGHRPTAIWVDPTTFDPQLGEKEREQVLRSFCKVNIPLFVVGYGEELSQALSVPYFLSSKVQGAHLLSSM